MRCCLTFWHRISARARRTGKRWPGCGWRDQSAAPAERSRPQSAYAEAVGEAVAAAGAANGSVAGGMGVPHDAGAGTAQVLGRRGAVGPTPGGGRGTAVAGRPGGMAGTGSDRGRDPGLVVG